MQEIKIEMDGLETELARILKPVIPPSAQISKKIKKADLKDKEAEMPKEKD